VLNAVEELRQEL